MYSSPLDWGEDEGEGTFMPMGAPQAHAVLVRISPLLVFFRAVTAIGSPPGAVDHPENRLLRSNINVKRAVSMTFILLLPRLRS